MFQIVPWAEMLKSMPVWAVMIAHFCQNWGFYTMLTHLPRILKELADYELEKVSCSAAIWNY